MTDKKQTYVFQQNLLGYLKKYDKTQLEVATAIGVSHQTFSTWCRGIALPRMGKIQLLADYFHINKSDLIEEHDPAAVSSDQDALVLSDHETKLVKAYRNASDDTQIAVCAVLGVKRDTELRTERSLTG